MRFQNLCFIMTVCAHIPNTTSHSIALIHHIQIHICIRLEANWLARTFANNAERSIIYFYGNKEINNLQNN